ncbi:MAG: CdaR family protein [Thermomicrobiales bacterium]
MRPTGFILPRLSIARPGSSAIVRLAVSFLLAIGLWGWVTNVQDPEREREYAGLTVDVEPPISGVEVVTDVSSVSVALTAPDSILDGLDRSELEPRLDLSGIDEPGTYQREIELDVPEAVRSVRISPRDVSIVVQETANRTFAVDFRRPDLGEGTRELGELQPDANQVLVSGPRSLIDSIAEVVVPIDIGDRITTFADDFPVVAVNGEGVVVDGIDLQPRTIQVRVPISTRGRSVPVLVTVEGEPAMGFEEVSRTTDPREVVIDGPAGLLEDVRFVSTRPVDIGGRTGNVQQAVEITGLPEGVRVLDPPSGSVDAIVQLSPRGQRRVLRDQPVRVIGADAARAITVAPAMVNVELLAAEPALSSLLSDDVTVIVDVAGLGEGIHEVEPSILLPPNVEWISTDPVTVSVAIGPVAGQATQSVARGTPAALPPPP